MFDRIFRKRRGRGGRGIDRTGKGLGRSWGNKRGSGPDGDCICPNCGQKISHQTGQRCLDLNCPKCGTKMMRE